MGEKRNLLGFKPFEGLPKVFQLRGQSSRMICISAMSK